MAIGIIAEGEPIGENCHRGTNHCIAPERDLAAIERIVYDAYKGYIP